MTILFTIFTAAWAGGGRVEVSRVTPGDGEGSSGWIGGLEVGVGDRVVRLALGGSAAGAAGALPIPLDLFGGIGPRLATRGDVGLTAGALLGARQRTLFGSERAPATLLGMPLLGDPLPAIEADAGLRIGWLVIGLGGQATVDGRGLASWSAGPSVAMTGGERAADRPEG